MLRNKVEDKYFEWLVEIVCGKKFDKGASYRRLLSHMYDTEFRYLLQMDSNRASDGVDLRYRFAYEHPNIQDAELYLDNGPCNVLEMIIALAIRCEEDTMDDASIGNRTGQWFWSMVVNLGLGPMVDNNYDRKYVNIVLNRFLEREYEPDGEGGLFRIRKCDCDLREVEIWHQMCWYLDEIT